MPRNVAVSRACVPCRARHLKCSEDRPSCRACLRAELSCHYLDDGDVVFRDQTQMTRENAERKNQRQRVETRSPRHLSSRAFQSDVNVGTKRSPPQEAEATRSPDHRPDHASAFLAFSLSDNIEDEALVVFFTRYCHQNRDPKGEQGLNNVLPTLYSRSSSTSAFSLSVAAFALAVVGRWPERMDFKCRSLEKYHQAVTAVNTALSHSTQMLEDEMLAAVMQLIAYEKMNLPHLPGSGVVHMNGLLTLLKHRGVQNCNTLISRQLLSVARTHAVTMHCSPFENLDDQDEHIWMEAPGDDTANLATELVKIAARIRCLRRMLRVTPTITVENPVQAPISTQRILTAALEIDNSLVDWRSRVPEAWMPFVAELIPTSVQVVGMYRDMCTLYCNIWAANSWNKYRLARIAIHAIILEQSQHLPIDQRDSGLILGSQQILQAETHGICSTVPFYLGSRDTTRTLAQPLIEFPTNSSVPLTEETRDHLVTLGEWFLFWPFSRMLHNLDMLSTKFEAPIDKEQHDWIRNQIIRNGWRAATRSSLSSNTA